MSLMLASGNFFAYLSTYFIAVLPFIEAKGAIPIGMSLGLSPVSAFFCSYVGSLTPVPFLLTLTIPALEYLEKNKKLIRLSRKIRKYIHKKTSKVTTQDNQLIASSLKKPIKLFALFFLVAIPIPGTGVWSGSLVASAFKLNVKHAFFVIAIGNFFASSVIFLATFGFFV
jgi:uncharacterized membrane protein